MIKMQEQDIGQIDKKYIMNANFPPKNDIGRIIRRGQPYKREWRRMRTTRFQVWSPDYCFVIALLELIGMKGY